MRDARKRLEKLEAGAGKGVASRWEVPIEVRIHGKMIERYRARTEGCEPPPYTQEEIEERRRWDLETLEGRGTQAHYRNSPDWQSEESQALLDLWEQDARSRVQKAKDLPPERWGEVWGVDEEE